MKYSLVLKTFICWLLINSQLILKLSDQTMTPNTCPKTCHIIYVLIAYCIKLVVLGHPNKMEFLNEKIAIYLKNSCYNVTIEYSKSLWSYGVLTTTSLINPLPSHVLDFKSLLEVLQVTSPDLAHLKVFGCTCFVHLPSSQCDKLDSRLMLHQYIQDLCSYYIT